ncbi:tRNA (guanine-N(1)-)-methyltransferase [Actinorhabdospora filicis]|uniref:tRNA (guanine-N(1)-)-methyltransferase n=1 Tax=Actinorhabdospora filicis TaxID=1785913 RepID=A0A9W6W772_9ACTN|nr:tRNA (guanosine(37)-N1)-methyltransferase TrmD [Actinorhabdospora filicis]GLZ75668.1 tRNA (guanine-N(1)-)-methyltransferase [Actinorhabdospora filicis]
MTNTPTRLDVVTLFPEYLQPLELSLIGRARQRGMLDVRVHELRTWTHDVHRTVDDSPYGGGPGMIMRPEPWGEAFDELVPEDGPRPRLIVPSPAGRPFTQRMATELAAEPWLMFACGRYEGIDQRVIDHARTRMEVTEVSLGDYVLFGGEVAVLVIVEAVARLIPGVLGNAASIVDESHSDGLLEAPMYTKPAEWRGLEVPEILLSGHHARIVRWKRDRALLRTAQERPDLLAALPSEFFDEYDRSVLTGAGYEVGSRDMAE